VVCASYSKVILKKPIYTMPLAEAQKKAMVKPSPGVHHTLATNTFIRHYHHCKLTGYVVVLMPVDAF
jgi:hypothetical protein